MPPTIAPIHPHPAPLMPTPPARRTTRTTRTTRTARTARTLAAVGAWAALYYLSPSAHASDPAELAKNNSCFSCHDMAKKLVGPGFAQVAAKYKGTADAPAVLAAKIRSGGQGNWGRISMPAQAQLSEADAQTLARWVLAQPTPQ